MDFLGYVIDVVPRAIAKSLSHLFVHVGKVRPVVSMRQHTQHSADKLPQRSRAETALVCDFDHDGAQLFRRIMAHRDLGFRFDVVMTTGKSISHDSAHPAEWASLIVVGIRELARHVTGTMKHAHDFDASRLRLIEEDVVANGKTAQSV